MLTALFLINSRASLLLLAALISINKSSTFKSEWIVKEYEEYSSSIFSFVKEENSSLNKASLIFLASIALFSPWIIFVTS